MPWTTLCELSELEEGKGKYVEIGGYKLGVYLSEGKVYTLDNNCPHAGGDLAKGWIADGCVICPRHLWPFHLENGQLRGAPGVAISTYTTRLHQPQGRPTFVQAELPMY